MQDNKRKKIRIFRGIKKKEKIKRKEEIKKKWGWEEMCRRARKMRMLVVKPMSVKVKS